MAASARPSVVCLLIIFPFYSQFLLLQMSAAAHSQHKIEDRSYNNPERLGKFSQQSVLLSRLKRSLTGKSQLQKRDLYNDNYPVGVNTGYKHTRTNYNSNDFNSFKHQPVGNFYGSDDSRAFGQQFPNSFQEPVRHNGFENPGMENGPTYDRYNKLDSYDTYNNFHHTSSKGSNFNHQQLQQKLRTKVADTSRYGVPKKVAGFWEDTQIKKDPPNRGIFPQNGKFNNFGIPQNSHEYRYDNGNYPYRKLQPQFPNNYGNRESDGWRGGGYGWQGRGDMPSYTSQYGYHPGKSEKEESVKKLMGDVYNVVPGHPSPDVPESQDKVEEHLNEGTHRDKPTPESPEKPNSPDVKPTEMKLKSEEAIPMPPRSRLWLLSNPSTTNKPYLGGLVNQEEKITTTEKTTTTENIPMPPKSQTWLRKKMLQEQEKELQDNFKEVERELKTDVNASRNNITGTSKSDIGKLREDFNMAEAILGAEKEVEGQEKEVEGQEEVVEYEEGLEEGKNVTLPSPSVEDIERWSETEGGTGSEEGLIQINNTGDGKVSTTWDNSPPTEQAQDSYLRQEEEYLEEERKSLLSRGYKSLQRQMRPEIGIDTTTTHSPVTERYVTERSVTERYVTERYVTEEAPLNGPDSKDLKSEQEVNPSFVRVVGHPETKANVAENKLASSQDSLPLTEFSSEKGANDVTSRQGENDVTSRKDENDVTSRQGDNDVTSRQGDNDVTSRQGNNDVTSRQGGNDVTSRQGDNDVTSRQGNNDVTSRQGGNDVTSRQGDNDVTSRQGDNDATSRQGNNDATSRQGDNDVTSRQGDNDATSRQGDNDATSRQGNNDVTSRQGNNDVTSRQGGNDVTSRQGDNDATSRQGNNDVTSRQGDNDATSRQGDNDATSRQGNNDVTSRQGGNDAHFWQDWNSIGPSNFEYRQQMLERERAQMLAEYNYFNREQKEDISRDVSIIPDPEVSLQENENGFHQENDKESIDDGRGGEDNLMTTKNNGDFPGEVNENEQETGEEDLARMWMAAYNQDTKRHRRAVDGRLELNIQTNPDMGETNDVLIDGEVVPLPARAGRAKLVKQPERYINMKPVKTERIGVPKQVAGFWEDTTGENKDKVIKSVDVQELTRQLLHRNKPVQDNDRYYNVNNPARGTMAEGRKPGLGLKPQEHKPLKIALKRNKLTPSGSQGHLVPESEPKGIDSRHSDSVKPESSPSYGQGPINSEPEVIPYKRNLLNDDESKPGANPHAADNKLNDKSSKESPTYIKSNDKIKVPIDIKSILRNSVENPRRGDEYYRNKLLEDRTVLENPRMKVDEPRPYRKPYRPYDESPRTQDYHKAPMVGEEINKQTQPVVGDEAEVVNKTAVNQTKPGDRYKLFNPHYYKNLMKGYRSEDSFWALLSIVVILFVLFSAVWFSKMWRKKDGDWSYQGKFEPLKGISIKDLLKAKMKLLPDLKVKFKRKRKGKGRSKAGMGQSYLQLVRKGAANRTSSSEEEVLYKLT